MTALKGDFSCAGDPRTDLQLSQTSDLKYVLLYLPCQVPTFVESVLGLFGLVAANSY